MIILWWEGAPHNDGWEPNRKLDFGGRKFNTSLLDMVENLVPPDRLSESVILGIKKIESSNVVRDMSALSLQEQLRPLFCPVEINFMSDMNPNEERNHAIKIPVEFFINKKLSGNQDENIFITRSSYENEIISTGSHFPETSLRDADHAWLTPIKAISDQIAIDRLVRMGLIDNKFAYDVLSIDMTNPVFSDARCSLLKYVPNSWTNDWKDKFIQQLKSSNNNVARELLGHLTNANYFYYLCSAVQKLKLQKYPKIDADKFLSLVSESYFQKLISNQYPGN